MQQLHEVKNQWLVTPYALDVPLPALARMARPGWALSSGVPSPSAAEDDGQLTRVAAIHAPIVTDVARIVGEGGRPVCIAGDCCVPIAVLAGLQKAGVEPMLVWFDAHGDFNTHETTISGFVGGMPIAMITGRGDQTLLAADGLKKLADTDIILADARDLDPAEKDLLDKSKVFRTSDFTALVERVAASDRPFHVHFDVDVIDSAEAPAMRYPVAGGPSVETLRNAAAQLHRTGRLVSATMNPWDLDNDTDGRTAAACWSIFNALVGGA